MCEHEESNTFVIPRIITGLILFAFGYIFKPLFLVAYLIVGADVLLRAIKSANICKIERSINQKTQSQL